MTRLARYEVRYIADGDEYSAGSVETLSDLRVLARATRMRLGYEPHDRRVWRIDHEPHKPPIERAGVFARRGRRLGVTRPPVL